MSILIKNAYILTLDSQDRIIPRGDILIQGDRILRIGQEFDAPQGSKVIDARGKLAMPGLNVAHAHSFGHLFKGYFDGLPLEIWMLGTNAPPLGWQPSSRLIYLRTVLGAVELIQSGATGLMDDGRLMPDRQDTLFAAYRDSGIRATVTAAVSNKSLPDRTVFLNELLPAELNAAMREDKLIEIEGTVEALEQTIEKWHGSEGRLNLALSLSWPQGCTDELMRRVRDLSYKHNLPINTHVLETKMQQVTGPVFYGQTIVRHLYELGLLTPRTTIIHSIWVTEDDIRIMGDAQISVVHNPSSNMVLGSGVMPMRHLLDAGVNIALGADEGIQSKWNPFEMMKMAALLQKAFDPDCRRWPTSHEILKMATYGGARCESIHQEVGSLAIGMKADVILLDLQSPSWIPMNDVKKQLVYSEQGTSVDTSIINGRLVMEGRKVLTVDADALREELRAEMVEFWKIQAERRTLDLPQKIRPHMEAAYWRAVRTETGLNRWLGDESEWLRPSPEKE